MQLVKIKRKQKGTKQALYFEVKKNNILTGKYHRIKKEPPEAAVHDIFPKLREQESQVRLFTLPCENPVHIETSKYPLVSCMS